MARATVDSKSRAKNDIKIHGLKTGGTEFLSLDEENYRKASFREQDQDFSFDRITLTPIKRLTQFGKATETFPTIK